MATRKKQQQQLTSIEHGRFDTAALQQELAQALEDDRVYKLTDSMKKRAIHTAANYDEFKNLVACADLKPISQRELRDFSRNARQTNLTYKQKSRKEFGKSLNFKASPADLNTPPASAVDFCRNWRRYLKTNEDKRRYLKLTTPRRLGEIFKADLDADLLAEIVHVLVVTWDHDSGGKAEAGAEPGETNAKRQEEFALDTLDAVSTTERLSLVLDFLDNNQVEKLQILFQLLERGSPCNQEEQLARLAALKAKFKI